jgi:DDE superfamily endonuclease
LKDLADVHFASAMTIVLVQDNLNIHSKASLYEAFPAAEARRLVERFEWHYTPKHGSWLDLAESAPGSCRPSASTADQHPMLAPSSSTFTPQSE